MTEISTTAPAWAARFLAALEAGGTMKDALSAAGIAQSTAYRLRKRDADFAARWDGLRPQTLAGKAATARAAAIAAARASAAPPGWVAHPIAKRLGRARLTRFLDALAETSNISAAAAEAGIETGPIYRLRRADATFASAWYAALAEGYDTLEMELLQHLRGGEPAAGAAKGRKFDAAIALRCLTSHREAVLREKGRRGLEGEVATIAAINAKIDRLRARRGEGDRAIAKAKRDGKARAKGVGGTDP